MGPSKLRYLAGALIVSAGITAGAGLAAAQESTPAPDTLTAAVFATTCADFAGGEPVEALRDLTLDNRNGEFRGLPSAMEVLDSDTELRISINTLLDAPHAIVVGDPANPVACGDIGGLVDLNDDDEDLDIGLWPVNDSGYFGIAEIDGDDDDNETEISVYVAVPNE